MLEYLINIKNDLTRSLGKRPVDPIVFYDDEAEGEKGRRDLIKQARFAREALLRDEERPLVCAKEIETAYALVGSYKQIFALDTSLSEEEVEAEYKKDLREAQIRYARRFFDAGVEDPFLRIEIDDYPAHVEKFLTEAGATWKDLDPSGEKSDEAMKAEVFKRQYDVVMEDIRKVWFPEARGLCVNAAEPNPSLAARVVRHKLAVIGATLEDAMPGATSEEIEALFAKALFDFNLKAPRATFVRFLGTDLVGMLRHMQEGLGALGMDYSMLDEKGKLSSDEVLDALSAHLQKAQKELDAMRCERPGALTQRPDFLKHEI